MAKSRRARGLPQQADDSYQLLLFPERAEYLDQARFGRYQIHLEHWSELSTEFRRAFEAVYVGGSARILLVHGEQGTGKTLFAGRVEDDFQRVKNKTVDDEQQNLWIVLAGGDGRDRALSERAAKTTELRRIHARSGWLEETRGFAKANESEMRVFLIDDVHKDVFLREWAELTPGEYTRLKFEGGVATVLESVAQRLVEDCRGDLQRSLFVLLSNDRQVLEALHEQLDRSHEGLARILSLPLPEPALKEKIVRTNTNRLNRWSYWYCLDRGGPDEKTWAYETLGGAGGFIDSFKAIGRAFAVSGPRSGRPANKNVLTLVTLGSDPLTVRSFIDDHELQSDESTDGAHVAGWLLEFMRAVPSIGRVKKDNDALQELARAIDDELEKLGTSEEYEAFELRFRAAGQSRSREYEHAIARRFGLQLSRGLAALPQKIRPDLTLSDYEPCAVTRASSPDPKEIEKVIRRTCHVIELTAHLQPDLRGLDDYIRDKVDVYATLLESV